MSDNTLNCAKCSTEMKETDAFCPKCGNPAGTQPKKKSSVGKKLLYGIGVIVGLFVFLVIIAAMGSPAHTQNNVAPSGNSPTTPAIENKEVCYFDWGYGIDSSIGTYYTAPTGYNYAIVTIYLKNNADKSISTNPYFWTLTADGIKYTVDSSTFSENINHHSVDVAKGGEIETSMVFVVKGNPAEATLKYSGFGPELVKIKHY
jgi:hypothetical protein